jgi:Porin-like glycoporin RafY
MKLFKLTALTAALLSVAAVQAAATVDANIELNNTSVTGAGVEQSGRVEINVSSKTGANTYVEGKASVIAGKSGTASIDDMWVKFGNTNVSLQLGRFEAADLFPMGKDTIVAKTNSGLGYQANALRGRTGGTPASFHGVVGFNSTPVFSGEFGIVNHKDTVANVSGFRPVVKANLGAVTIALGAELVKDTAATLVTTSSRGTGLTAGFKALGGDINVNLANRSVGSLKSRSIGVNGTFGGLGLGFVQDKSGTATGKTMYAAYEMSLLGVKGASITPAVSKSSASTAAKGTTGLNVRINYTF